MFVEASDPRTLCGRRPCGKNTVIIVIISASLGALSLYHDSFHPSPHLRPLSRNTPLPHSRLKSSCSAPESHSVHPQGKTHCRRLWSVPHVFNSTFWYSSFSQVQASRSRPGSLTFVPLEASFKPSSMTTLERILHRARIFSMSLFLMCANTSFCVPSS